MAHERDRSTLAGPVQRNPDREPHLSRARRDRDDPAPAPRAHVVGDGARAVQHAVEVEVDHPRPLRGVVVAEAGEPHPIGNARVVDQHVDGPQPRLHRRDARLRRRERGDVERGGYRAPARALDLLRDALGALRVEIVDRHRRTARRERARDARADVLARAGHERNFAGEVEHESAPRDLSARSTRSRSASRGTRLRYPRAAGPAPRTGPCA